MYKCECGYTLEKCTKHKSNVAHPPKFAWPDKYGHYRRKQKGIQ